LESTLEKINSPNHYTDGGIETIDYIKAKMSEQSFKDYCRGHVLKYASRAGKKEGNSELQDIQKVIKFAQYWQDAIVGEKASLPEIGEDYEKS